MQWGWKRSMTLGLECRSQRILYTIERLFGRAVAIPRLECLRLRKRASANGMFEQAAIVLVGK